MKKYRHSIQTLDICEGLNPLAYSCNVYGATMLLTALLNNVIVGKPDEIQQQSSTHDFNHQLRLGFNALWF